MDARSERLKNTVTFNVNGVLGIREDNTHQTHIKNWKLEMWRSDLECVS